MDTTKSGIAQQASKETAGDETYDGEPGLECEVEISSSSHHTGACSVSAHERHIRFQELKAISVQITRDHGKEDRSYPLQARSFAVYIHKISLVARHCAN
jgi:hypothetical protein